MELRILRWIRVGPNSNDLCLYKKDLRQTHIQEFECGGGGHYLGN